MPVAGGKVEEFPGQPCAAKKLEPAVTIRSCIITGQFSHRMFQNLPPILCVPLKNIVDDDFLLAGHIFLGFTKCGRYVLSYTRDVPEQDIDELPYYVYYLYWWKFNIHDKLKKVRQVHLFKDQEVYSDLYLTVCEWPSDPSKLIVFGFNIRSVNDLLINMVMSDENDRDIYITTVATPPFSFCPDCKDMALLSTDEQNAYCLQHGFMLHTKYQVVYPFPTFQPAFQLKKDGVVLLNTSYSLVACAISVNTTDEKGQILYSKSSENTAPPGHSELDPNLISPVMDDVMSSYLQCEAPSHPSSSHGGPNCILHKADTTGCAHTEYCPEEMLSWELKSSKHGGLAACNTSHGEQSSAAGKAKEFAADIFRRARAATNTTEVSGSLSQAGSKPKEGVLQGLTTDDCHKVLGTQRSELSNFTLSSCSPEAKSEIQCSSCVANTSASALNSEHSHSQLLRCSCPALGNGVLPAAELRTEMANELIQCETGTMNNTSSQHHETTQTEPGYVNYIKLHYVLEPSGMAADDDDGYDDKISLHFVVTDLRGRNLKPVKESALYQGKYLTVEQLTLDFEYVINEIIRNDASWSKRYCSFSDYDIVILEVCPITNHVIINIGLLLLAYPSDEEGQIRPKTYHTCLKGTWNLNTGVFATMGVGDLTAVQGQTSGSVWSTFRKSCVDIAMRWLVPESTFRNVNRMTNEALHKGRSLKRLADSGRSMWIVL
ncbi:DDB1- and CUL4-associated factor 15 isoform X1 [Chiloscyllium plagiosum]|uniref:DDB1- and CUL4-associated factor 15 isoform X1 n=1 Tax=Chiloscyllium plagiosum TaxID=36176 RepID=UPI001CB7D164|nr:DDB1- and CUL4-associated factor 15 isoform X1 [Chiloscyllium plagiosum]